MTEGWDPREDAWLAGFADGEGSFTLTLCRHRQHIAPRFHIALRADDAPVLHRLCEVFGGTINYDRCERKAHGPRSSPNCVWVVCSKRDLASVMRYFDRFPLRAKKARDYVIWRQAALIYCAKRGGGRDPRLVGMRDALTAGRVFDATAADRPAVDDPFEVQTALEID